MMGNNPQTKGKEMKDINFKRIAYVVYQELRGLIEKKVKSTESIWDDQALNAADLLVEKFLKPEDESKDEVQA